MTATANCWKGVKRKDDRICNKLPPDPLDFSGESVLKGKRDWKTKEAGSCPEELPCKLALLC